MTLKQKIIMGHIKEWVKHCAMWMLIGMGLFIVIIVANSVLRGDRIDPDNPMGPPHNYWHPTWDDDNPRTIVPDGQGVIEYPDGTQDSIRWQSDELRMWITAENDTIWE